MATLALVARVKAHNLHQSPLVFVIGSSLPEYSAIIAESHEDDVAFVRRGFAFLSGAVRFPINFNLP
jgi:hypothetical protein